MSEEREPLISGCSNSMPRLKRKRSLPGHPSLRTFQTRPRPVEIAEAELCEAEKLWFAEIDGVPTVLQIEGTKD